MLIDPFTPAHGMAVLLHENWLKMMKWGYSQYTFTGVYNRKCSKTIFMAFQLDIWSFSRKVSFYFLKFACSTRVESFAMLEFQKGNGCLREMSEFSFIHIGNPYLYEKWKKKYCLEQWFSNFLTWAHLSPLKNMHLHLQMEKMGLNVTKN